MECRLIWSLILESELFCVGFGGAHWEYMFWHGRGHVEKLLLKGSKGNETLA